MMSLNNIKAFYNAESAITRGLSRYWVFIGIAFLISIVIVFFTSVIHTFGSSASSSLSIFAPRYGFASIGMYYLIIFTAGIIFLAFDIRARDQRERMVDILDSRPYSNLELLAGRISGLLMCVWIPVVVLVLLVQLLGWLAVELGFPFFSLMEPYSLLSFPVFIALPAMLLCCASIVLITLLVRQQVVAFVLSGALLAGLYTISIGLTFPYAISSSFDVMGFSQSAMSSDWIPAIARDYSGWLQRLGVVLLSVGLVFFSAIIHPRLEKTNTLQQLAAGSLFCLSGVLLMLMIYTQKQGEIEQLASWRQTHEQQQSVSSPDVSAITGHVEIEPEDGLFAQLDIIMSAPANTKLNQALLSLNPGFDITSITSGSGQELNFDFQNGLLRVRFATPLTDATNTIIHLKYQGKPDNLFGYLDSAIDIRDLDSEHAATAILGVDNGIFNNQYVALMPGIHWMPAAGVDIDPDDGQPANHDFFTVQLDVTVPSHWKVAGPGKRIKVQDSGTRITYQYAPEIPLPEVAILAAPFSSYMTEIDGIAFELLMHPKHRKNVEYLAKGREQIKLWIKDRLSLAADVGLEYPFSGFSLVEVPNTLRGFKGGWKMDTAMAPPAMVLIKESGLAEARFDFDSQTRPLLDGKDDEGLAKVIRNRLVEFYRSDMVGSNVFAGIADSFFYHQSKAQGDDAVALEYLMKELTSLAITDHQGYFSPYKIATLFKAAPNTVGNEANRGENLKRRVMRTREHETVWQTINTTSLLNLEQVTDPVVAADMLTLKVGNLARLIYDLLGPGDTGKAVAQVLAKGRGADYTRQDVVDALASQSPQMAQLMDDWFESNHLAGFMVDGFEIYQLPNDSSGNTQYQLKVRIINEEPVAGYTKISWSVDEEEAKAHSQPIRVAANSAVEFAWVLLQPPLEVHLEPYMSLNRRKLLVTNTIGSNIETRREAGLHGINILDVVQDSNGPIVVDDLDPGFSLVQHTSSGTKISYPNSTETQSSEQQQLLMVHQKVFPGQWRRLQEDTSWGKYRNTLTFIRAGEGNNQAGFKTQLPSRGQWALSVHLPENWLVRGEQLGKWELQIKSENRQQTIEFNASEGHEGWNPVGEYRVAAGEIEVLISDKTTGVGTIADSISWTRVSDAEAASTDQTISMSEEPGR